MRISICTIQGIMKSSRKLFVPITPWNINTVAMNHLIILVIINTIVLSYLGIIEFMTFTIMLQRCIQRLSFLIIIISQSILCILLRCSCTLDSPSCHIWHTPFQWATADISTIITAVIKVIHFLIIIIIQISRILIGIVNVAVILWGIIFIAKVVVVVAERMIIRMLLS